MVLFQITQIVYWLALSTWFGGILFVAVAAPIIFRTLGESGAVLPDVRSANLEGRHASLLAGSVVANLLSALTRIELICAGFLLLAIISQGFIAEHANLVARAVIYVAAVAAVLYDWRVVGPQLRTHRQEFIDHVDEPDLANAAKARFDYYHAVSVNLLSLLLVLLLLLIVCSGGISPHFIELTSS